MTNPTYDVHISWIPKTLNTSTNVSIATGVTVSIPTYNNGYFVATMRDLNISGTGVDYRSALDAVLVIATASSTSDPGLMPPKQTF